MRHLPVTLLLALVSPIAGWAHPHVFVDTGIDLITDESGKLIQVKVTWAYDAFYSLLITEDMGLDPDGDMVLTEAEQSELTGFDANWDPGFAGDLVARLGESDLTLSRPIAPTAEMREGRIVTTHLRDVAEQPTLAGEKLTLLPYDPTYYTAYDVTLPVTVAGAAECDVALTPPEMDDALSEMQDKLLAVDAAEDPAELGLGDMGRAFATEVRITCAGG
jgi:ABC-type uncharacterized transport system substrate-binding protein